MKPLVKSLTGAALLLAVIAGCASKTTGGGPNSAAAGSAGSANSPTTSQSALGDSAPPPTTSTSTGTATSPKPPPTSSVIPPGAQLPSLTPPSVTPGYPGAKPGPVTDQVRYSSPESIALAADGRTLVTPVQWGGCAEQPQLIVTAQDSMKVLVEVKTVTHFRMGAMCPDIARVGEASVKLDAPLGGRQVIDAILHVGIPTR